MFSGVLVVALASLLLLLRRQPVLLHVFAETECACGDYDRELTGLTVFNPLRDRSPERTADNFFATLREGRCPSVIEPKFCDYALDRRATGWKLAYRSDRRDRVSLYFKLTKLGSGPQHQFTGGGLLELAPTGVTWKVVVYESYF